MLLQINISEKYKTIFKYLTSIILVCNCLVFEIHLPNHVPTNNYVHTSFAYQGWNALTNPLQLKQWEPNSNRGLIINYLT